jgi:basic membrane protein A
MKISKVKLFFIAALMVIFMASAGWSKEFKAAFVYVGPVGDGGWTYAHDLGRRHLESLGVRTSYIESVPEPDSERVLRNLARKKNDMIFTTSFGFMDPTFNTAKKYPKTTFLHCSGFKTADNMGNYFGRMYQAKFLTGMLAGYMTKSNIIGIVGSHPIPEIIRHINSFTLGVRFINPEAKVKVIWINEWHHPSKEAEAANSLMDVGVDIVTIATDSAGALRAAQKRSKYAIGNDSDMTLYAPDAHLVSAVFNWGIYYEHIYRQLQNGTWKPSADWWGLETGIVDISKFGYMVPETVQKNINRVKKLISKGAFTVFEGPINDQNKVLAIPKGVKLTDSELLSMDFFVEGVEGSLPN